MNGSISLLRANPALTTNYKLVVDTQYNLYLESYSANRELSDKKFKKFQITADSFLSQRIASFYGGLPTDLAFAVKNDIQSDVIQSDFNSQIDDIYYSGARAVEDTRYQEEFQYNTTLKITPSKLPKYFMIFRADGPGTEEMISGNEVPIDATNVDSPVFYIRDKTKLIASFDLTPQTNFGRLWKKNYIDDDLLLRSPVELNFKKNEFSKWNGYDYYTGGTVSKSFFLNEYMQNQNTPFEFESFITDGFKKNAVISSHYTNISFLFDDTVSGIFYKSDTPGQFKYYEKDYPFITKYIQEGNIKTEQYTKTIEPVTDLIYYTFTESVPYRRKWTINRYTGFYVDELLLEDTLSPYVMVEFKTGQGIYLVNNVFRESNSPTAASVSPVMGTYDAQLPVYFKIDTELFLIEFQNNEYNIVSNKIFNGDIDTFILNAQKPIKIDYQNDNLSTFGPTLKDTFRSYLKHTDDTYYTNTTMLNNLVNSFYVIKILDNYYRLNFDNYNFGYYINTDEYISCDSSLIKRKLGFNNARVENIQILTKDNSVTYFQIYQLQFTEIGDWDFKRENTRFAEIEYNKNDNVSHNRPFLYSLDIKDTNVPKDNYNEKYYKIWVDDQLVLLDTYLLYDDTFVLPLSSEYAASGDLYMLDKTNKLTRIWDLNQSVVKWGIYKSINNMAYPYSANNSLDVCGPYNFTPNIYSSYVDSKEMTLDWFYTLGKPIIHDPEDYNNLVFHINHKIYNITERTLNIDLPRILFPRFFNAPFNLNLRYKFDIEYYKSKNAVIDYFDYIFNLPVAIENFAGIPEAFKYYDRAAHFTESDKVNGPSVFFKGLSAYIQYVDTTDPNTNKTFKTTPANDLAGYAFSILFNSRFTDSPALLGKAGIEIILNKIYKNVLINIYVYTLPGTYTSLDYRERDSAYDDTRVRYAGWDDPMLMTGYKFYSSELPMQSLTLKTMADILRGNKLTHPNFSRGIKYTVVENVDEYPIESMTANYDFSDNVTEVTINFINDLPLQHGEWIFLQNTTSSQFDRNFQIAGKNSNRSIIIYVVGNQTTQVSVMNTILATIVCTKEQSVYPFRLVVNNPDEIKVNKFVNNVIGDTSCPVLPKNMFTANTDIVVSNEDYFNNVPHVYVDDNISRRMLKTNNNIELPYSVIDKLPSAFRYSGDYEPILHGIDLFRQSAINAYNRADSSGVSEGAKALYMESALINGKYYISVHIKDLFGQLYNADIGKTNIKVGDIFYVMGTDNFPWLQFRTGHVIDVSESSIIPPGPDKSFKITLSLEFAVNPVLIGLDLVALGKEFLVILFKYSKTNTQFEYGYADFGKIPELNIAKVYQGVNPLQTSNEIWKTTNKFPMIDEHGTTTTDRNLFKSSWDPAFYYKTVSKKYFNKT
jgi:hypothetical protein